MSLRCGAICNNHFVENFVPSLAVKEFWKSIEILRGYQHEQGVLFFDSEYVVNKSKAFPSHIDPYGSVDLYSVAQLTLQHHG